MTRTHVCLSLLACALLPLDAAAFCVYNGLKDRNVVATVVASTLPKPAKLYSEVVAPGKESCCNPKNTECNPSKIPDTSLALMAFEARIQALDVKGPAPARAPPSPVIVPQVVSCGKPTADKNYSLGVEASIPARSYLRFEPNPKYNPQMRYGWDNHPYVLKVLVGPDNRLYATYPCPPKPDPKVPGQAPR